MSTPARLEDLLRQAIALSPDPEMLYIVGQGHGEAIVMPFLNVPMVYFRNPPFPEARARMHAGIIYAVQHMAEAQRLEMSFRSILTVSGYYSYSVKIGKGVGSTSQIKAIAWLSAYVDHLQRSKKSLRQ